MVSLPNQLSCQTEVVVIYNETVESVDWTRVVLAVKSLPASVGDAREVSSIPGSGRSPEDGNGNPLQYSCLENFMDRGAWWAIVHGVEKSWAWQSDWTHTHTQNGVCDRGPEAEWLLNCVASGQKGWIPRWENQNAILDALIQNLASTLLPLKKKKNLSLDPRYLAPSLTVQRETLPKYWISQRLCYFICDVGVRVIWSR